MELVGFRNRHTLRKHCKLYSQCHIAVNDTKDEKKNAPRREFSGGHLILLIIRNPSSEDINGFP